MKFLKKSKGIIFGFIILILSLSIVTFCHILYLNLNKNFEKNDDNSIDYLVPYNKVKEIDYNYIKNDLDYFENSINNSENSTIDDNIHKIDFYKNKSQIYENKLREIEKVLENKLLDDRLKSELNYNINKFLQDLDVLEKQQKRFYESTIDASLNIYINRSNSIKNKCYEILEEFKTILENN